VKSPVSDTSDKPGFRTITNKDIPTSISTSPGQSNENIDGFICCFTLRFELDDVNNSGDGRDEVLWVDSDFISPSLLEHRLDLWLLDEALVDETDSEVMECEMVELFAADSVDLTGEEVDDDRNY
jgi:hypothetical protein